MDSDEYKLKISRDLKGVIDTAFGEGRKEEKLEIAKALKDKGVATEIISSTTGLSTKEIEQLSIL